MNSAIRLFKALPIEKNINKINKEKIEIIYKETIPKGFIFSEKVLNNYNLEELFCLIKDVEKEIGLTSEQMNNSFHKSWKKIKESSMTQLFMEQIIHYITTYGFENLGIYNKESIYIPQENLEIPSLKIDGISLIVINGYFKEEFKKKTIDLVSTGIALSKDILDDVLNIFKFVDIQMNEIDDIKNKEIKIMLYKKFNIVPEDPIESLRYIIYIATGETLLIKNNELIEKIKNSEHIDSIKLFYKYKNSYGLPKLSEIFYRFKPLFLAFKQTEELCKIINKIRRFSPTNHKPLKEDYLNSITSKIKNGQKIYRKVLIEELQKVNIFRKIKLAYALNYRTKDVNSILYKIRNGKSYVMDFNYNAKEQANIILNIILNSICSDIYKNVGGKKIYIPEFIQYSLPTTEKQFTGYFPIGTCVSISKDIIVGIHWEDVKDHRIDLDLSLISNNQKIGWDGSYKTEKSDILFSGDLTSAPKPKGASELFYIQKQRNDIYIMTVNYFNYDKNIPVPFKIIVASDNIKSLDTNYMIDPNKIIAIAKSEINKKQKVLGLLVVTEDECKFYFTETYIGNSITSQSTSKHIQQSKDYLFNFYENNNLLSLNTLLHNAGAFIVKDKDICDIDLSPELLEKDTIINLLK